MFGGKEKNGNSRSNLPEAEANGDLFVEGEGGTDDGEVVARLEQAADSIVNREDQVSAVAREGKKVGARAEARDVSADSKNADRLRIFGKTHIDRRALAKKTVQEGKSKPL